MFFEKIILTSKTHEFFGLNSLLFVGLVCICLFMGNLLIKNKFYYISESGISMLFGLILGIFIRIAGREESEFVKFRPEVFFYVLLPPIIFEAGFNLKKENFFNNVFTILLYAVFGTIISTLVIGIGMYGLAKIKLVPLNTNSIIESLMFGSLISAVDPISILSILRIKELKTDPLLYSLIFGESVLNDAVSIVLFKTFEGYYVLSNKTSNSPTLNFINTFCLTFIGSIVVGIAIGLFCSSFLKHSDFKSYPSYEFAIIFISAYGTYCIAEILSISGIVSLFFCSLVMSHYAIHNVSEITRMSAQHIFITFSMISEIFVFAYLGIYGGVSLKRDIKIWNLSMIFFTIILCLISRALSIFSFSFIANLKRYRKITRNMQIFIWFNGLRGAIAFALALNFPKDLIFGHFGENNSFIISTTFVIVFITTLLCGGTSIYLLKTLNLIDGVDKFNYDLNVIKESNDIEHSKFKKFWERFEQYFMRNAFGGKISDEENRQMINEDN